MFTPKRRRTSSFAGSPPGLSRSGGGMSFSSATSPAAAISAVGGGAIPKKGARKRVYAKGVSTRVKAYVQASLRQTAEQKFCSNFGINTSTVAQIGGIVTPQFFNTMLPGLAAGGTNYQRIGNEIRPTKLRSTFSIFIDQTNSNVDCYVNLVCVVPIAISDQNQISQLPAGRLLMSGTVGPIDPAQSYGPQTKLVQVDELPINTDAYRLIKRVRIRLQKNAGTANNVEQYAVPNSSMSSLQKITVVTRCPKVLTYNDPAAVYPTNFAPVWCAWTTPVDVALPQSVWTVTCAALHELFFEDS